MEQVTVVRRADLVVLMRVVLHTGESVPIYCRRGEKGKAEREEPWRKMVLRRRAEWARAWRKMSVIGNQ